MATDSQSLAGEPTDQEIGELLSGVVFPLNKDALVDAARDRGVNNDVIAALDGLPEQDYLNAAMVVQFIGSAGGGALGAS